MANEIRGLVVHKFEKLTHEKGTIVPRGSAVEITEAVQRLVDALHSLYGDKSGKGYGRFEDDEDTYPQEDGVVSPSRSSDEPIQSAGAADGNSERGRLP